VARSEWALGFRRPRPNGEESHPLPEAAPGTDTPPAATNGAVHRSGETPARGSLDSSRFEDTWRRIRGSASAQWGRLTNDDLGAIRTRDQLLVRLQERHARPRDILEQEITAFDSRGEKD